MTITTRHLRPHELRAMLGRSHTLNGACLDGVDGRLVEIQAVAVDVMSRQKPWAKCVTASGIGKSEGLQLLHRVGAALASQGIPVCPLQISLHFHAGDAAEASGSSLDLPTSLALLLACEMMPEFDAGEYLFFGELDACGDVRGVGGALALCCAARHGQKVVFPDVNSPSAILSKAVRDIILHPVGNLYEVLHQQPDELKGQRVKTEPIAGNPPDFGTIRGLERAKRAAEIAAAGGHAALLVGSPGVGKTLLSNAIAGILPPLSDAEQVELTRIYSAAGMLPSDRHAVTGRPFRTVHHSATPQSIVGGGGGNDIKPGEITLAHLGVLFLDEIAEFKSETLEALRQPMEDGAIRISRVNRKVELPCRFSLVAAMNPCPCGYAPDCDCKPKDVEKYQSKLSGPLLDRIDLRVRVEPPTPDSPTGEPSETIRCRVVRAMDRQRQRYEGTGIAHNADAKAGVMWELFAFTDEARELLSAETVRGGLSLRSHDRVARVARTIADLADVANVLPEHVAEAVSFL